MITNVRRVFTTNCNKHRILETTNIRTHKERNRLEAERQLCPNCISHVEYYCERCEFSYMPYEKHECREKMTGNLIEYATYRSS